MATQNVTHGMARVIITLPDGYNGHLAQFDSEPIERDGAHVKLRCSEQGKQHLIRWIMEEDLRNAMEAQIADAKAWIYRDETEGVQLLSLDRLAAEKRTAWTSERPLDTVPESLVDLTPVHADTVHQSAAMKLINAAHEGPEKIRKVAERMLLAQGGNQMFGHLVVSKDQEESLKSMGFKVGAYDTDAACFHVCVDSTTFNRRAAEAQGIDLSNLRLRSSARIGADDYPATIAEIEAEISWCEFALHMPSDFGRKPEKLVDIGATLSSLRWDLIEKKIGDAPTPVTVVASHASYPLECSATGLLLSGGRVVIDYPFHWKDGADPSFDPDAQIDISHVVLADGNELPSGWREISADDLTREDFSAIDKRRQSLEMAIAKGEELPTTDEALARVSKLLEETRWTIDMDSGRVVDKGWNGTDEPEVGTEYRSVAADFEGVVRVSSVSGDRVYYNGDAEGSATVSEFKEAYSPQPTATEHTEVLEDAPARRPRLRM